VKWRVLACAYIEHVSNYLSRNTCRDTARIEAGGCKLFVLGAGLSGRDLSEELRACMVPPGYLPLADIDLDFPEVAAALSAGEPFFISVCD
jgi:hypothetical protein